MPLSQMNQDMQSALQLQQTAIFLISH